MGMNWRKIAAIATVSVLSASVLSACATKAPETPPAGGAPAAQQKVELEFWGWWSSETRMPTINKIVNEWNSKNPNIQVKYTFVPFGELETKYLASVAAGNPPDMIVVPSIFTTPFRGSKKQAMDLSTLGADQIKDQYYPQFWNAVQYQGKPYALPWMGETKFLYYNKDIFKEVGLDPEKAPVTWDDFWAMSDKIDKKEGTKLVRAGFHPLFGNFGYSGWVWNAGSDFFKSDTEPTINNAKNVEVLNWVKKWTDRYGYEAYSAFKGGFGGGPQHPFIQGKVAMTVETATFERELKKNAPNMQYGVVPIPTPDGKQHQNASYTGGFAAEIPVGAKHPKESFEFAKYWTTDAAVVWAQEQNDFAAYNKAAEKITTPEFKRMADNMKYTGLILLPMTAPSYNDAVNPAIDEVLPGRMSAQDALTKAQADVEKMVKEGTK